MDTRFLLSSATAEALYATVRNLPIIDYHNHLSDRDIADNRRFYNVYDLWVKPDPYKHRAMRMCGVEERCITGDAPVEEKFEKWCETLPRLIGNPLYVWSKMELEAVFGYTETPCAENAEKLYCSCNEFLQENEITARTLLEKFHVEYACPCASLVDDVSIYEATPQLAPSLRGNDIVALSEGFLKKQSALTEAVITDLPALEQAICLRLDAFVKCGCRFSDHALDDGFIFHADDGKNGERFKRLLAGDATADDQARLSSYMLLFLGTQYAKRRFVMQLHIGAQRYTSTRLREKAGAAGGFAGIGNSVNVKSLTVLLDSLDLSESGLPKTVLFTLNPADNALMSVLSGSYARDGVSGLITQGPAWWWCDHSYGITEALEHASAFGVLSNFLGMTTDSRSFLSFVRHDYFRRILCSFLGRKYEANELGCTYAELERLARRVCYENARMEIGGCTDEASR